MVRAHSNASVPTSPGRQKATSPREKCGHPGPVGTGADRCVGTAEGETKLEGQVASEATKALGKGTRWWGAGETELAGRRREGEGGIREEAQDGGGVR